MQLGLVKGTHLGEMFRDMQLAVRSISHAAVMSSAAVVRPVIQHMPAHIPKLVLRETAVTHLQPVQKQ